MIITDSTMTQFSSYNCLDVVSMFFLPPSLRVSVAWSLSQMNPVKGLGGECRNCA